MQEQEEAMLRTAYESLKASDAALKKEQKKRRRSNTGLVVCMLAIVVGFGVAIHMTPESPAVAQTTTTTVTPPTTSAPTTTTAAPQIAEPTSIVRPPAPTTTAVPKVEASAAAPVVVRGVPTCANPNPDKVSAVNAYNGPMGPDQIKKMVCGG